MNAQQTLDLALSGNQSLRHVASRQRTITRVLVLLCVSILSLTLGQAQGAGMQQVPLSQTIPDIDIHGGLVSIGNRPDGSLPAIRHEDSQLEKRVLGHYMTWYQTPKQYGGPACSNLAARGEWRMWNTCGHDPDTVTGTHGFRDVAAVHYPLIGPYDSADPKIIEYHLLQAIAAEVDTFVINFYGENDVGGIDEAALRVLQQVEEMNAQYAKSFKIALMYDEGALVDISPALRLDKAISDFDYMFHTYAGNPAYLWGDGKPVMFYFPKGPLLSAEELMTVTASFSLVYPNFPPDYLTVTNGSYAWVQADPWMSDGSNWGEPYLRWFYPTLDFTAGTVPTFTFGVGAVWAGFDDVGVGKEWSCTDHRWIHRRDGQVYDWTWDILSEYNNAVGITYTLPISWVQLATLNDYMEGTTLFASAEVSGVDGVNYAYGYGYQYVQKTEDYAQEFKGLPADAKIDIYIAQHIYNARWASEFISNTALTDDALDAFHTGHYTEAMALADEASGIPAPEDIHAIRNTDVMTVSWQDRPGTTLASGHRIYYGLEPGKYVSSAEVLTGSSVILTDLTPQTTYYVAVTTLGATNPCETWYVSESWYSDEVMAPPVPTGVIISGPITGVINDIYTFTATVTTTVGSAVLPLTYIWEATERPAPVTHTSGGLTDTAVFSWPVPGSHVVTVTVMNPGGAISTTHAIVVNIPLSKVTIDGPTRGLMNSNYVFTAIITPPTATLPVTYTWKPEPENDQGAVVTYTWAVTGPQTIVVTATNATGRSVSDTHVIAINIPLASVTITGPTQGRVNVAYTFTAFTNPTTATKPVTYTWTPMPTGGQGATAVYTWKAPGAQTITVAAINAAGISVSATHTIALKTYVYLPLVLRRYPPIPDTPTLNPIGASDSSGNYDVSWNDAYLAETYTLEEDSSPTFANPTIPYSGTVTSWSARNHPAGMYYYRVKASNTWGDSGWSNVQSVLVVVCTVTGIEIGGNPFAAAYNPVNGYVYVLNSGMYKPQAVVLQDDHEVGRIDFPSGGFQELTSVGVNPVSGMTYVTQWGNDTVHFVNGLRKVGSYRTGYWGTAGVWPSPLTNATYVSGKWYDSTSKVVRFTGTRSRGLASVGYDANPNAGVVAGNNQCLYLANSYADTVSVIASSSLLATINVGDHPNGIAYNPANGYVYVVNRGTAATQSTVSVINGTQVAATIALGPGYNTYMGVDTKDAITLWGNTYYGGTDIVTVDPTTGYVYVSNWGANTVSILSGTELLATVTVGVRPNSIAYNAVRDLIYVANTGNDTVTILRDTRLVTTVSVGDYPIDLAIDTQSGFVYVASRTAGVSLVHCQDNPY